MLSLFAINVIASDKSPENSDITKDKSAEALMAGMSDEQVRRLLIVELKKEAGKNPTIVGPAVLPDLSKTSRIK